MEKVIFQPFPADRTENHFRSSYGNIRPHLLTDPVGDHGIVASGTQRPGADIVAVHRQHRIRHFPDRSPDPVADHIHFSGPVQLIPEDIGDNDTVRLKPRKDTRAGHFIRFYACIIHIQSPAPSAGQHKCGDDAVQQIGPHFIVQDPASLCLQGMIQDTVCGGLAVGSRHGYDLPADPSGHHGQDFRVDPPCHITGKRGTASPVHPPNDPVSQFGAKYCKSAS